MRIGIDLSIHHYNLLVDISNFTGMPIKEIIESTVRIHIEEFDKAMDRYLKEEVWGDSLEE